jgi:hypothetical protein
MKHALENDRRTTRMQAPAGAAADDDAYWLGGEALVVPLWDAFDEASADAGSGWDDPSWKVL